MKGFNWFYRLTGGRPMRHVSDSSFRDKKTGKSVSFYCDRLEGAYWLASGPWAFDRFRQPGAANRIIPLGTNNAQGVWHVTPLWQRCLGFPEFRRKAWDWDREDFLPEGDTGLYYWEYSNNGDRHD